MKNIKLLTVAMLLSLAGISLQAKDKTIVSGNDEQLVQLLLGNTNYTSDNQQPTVLSNIKSVPSFQIAVLPENAIKKLLPTQASVFIEMWTSPDINEINFIEALTKDQVAGLSTTALLNAFSSLSSKQVGYIVSSQLSEESGQTKLSTEKEAILKLFTSDNISWLDKGCVKGLSDNALLVIAPLITDQMKGNKLTSDQKKLIKNIDDAPTA